MPPVPSSNPPLDVVDTSMDTENCDNATASLEWSSDGSDGSLNCADSDEDNNDNDPNNLTLIQNTPEPTPPLTFDCLHSELTPGIYLSSAFFHVLIEHCSEHLEAYSEELLHHANAAPPQTHELSFGWKQNKRSNLIDRYLDAWKKDKNLQFVNVEVTATSTILAHNIK